MRLSGSLRKLYGITVLLFEELLKRQNGVCAICKKTCSSKPRLSVDHDHLTKTVRGLLCANCNHGLGHFKDSPTLLRAAALYLEGKQSS